jgi:hypothetical protein
VLAREPADAAAEREPGDAGVRDLAAGHGETVLLRRAVDVAPQRTCLRARRLPLGVDPDLAHAREVEDEAAVDRRVAGRGVATAADRQLDARLACKADDRDHVERALHARDRRRAAVDHPVPHAACLVVGRVAGPDQLALELRSQLIEGAGGLHRGHLDSFRLSSL